MTVVTRFAPSPTGFLHIGGARTALFNWFFAKHHQGKFLLRIEDTDRERSTDVAVDAIFDSLKWLDLDFDDKPVFQFERANRHAEVAHNLLKQGKAYYCYCSPEELEQMREEARQNGKPPRYNGFWRDRDPKLAPANVKPVIRLKTPQTGELTIEDLVQGNVCVQNNQLDDLVLLRADGTPTYMLSVVVDDHDMHVTHIIRGDDHLTNAFRQIHIYHACGWNVPIFAHIPLIHGPDGAKLSKRHGALGTEAYRDMGFLPEAMCNYLIRLGWSHGDDEIMSREQIIQWFDTDAIGKSPARLDLAKLTHINAHYLRETSNQRLLDLSREFLTAKLSRQLTTTEETRLLRGMNGLKQRAKTLIELADAALFYCVLSPLDDKAIKFTTPEAKALIQAVISNIEATTDFTENALENLVRQVAEQTNQKLGNIAQPLRVALTGSTISPSVFEIMDVLEKEETLNRLKAFIT